MIRFFQSLTLLFAILSAQYACASEAADELFTALAPFDNLSGEFKQQQFDDRGGSLAKSSGIFRVLRPHYFAWDIESPDSQLVIAGPKFLWHYDRDLATATRRAVDTAGTITPLQILAGDRDAIADRLTVTREGPGSFLLQPSSTADSGFKRLSLRFSNGMVAEMEILDNLEQRLLITFDEVDGETTLTEADFAFVPPPEADLFYHD